MRRRGVGFTLIELLVVIAIISILASILLPVYSRARARARQSKCLTYQKQILYAFKMYCDDFDEILPLGGYATVGGENGLFASGRLQWYDLIFTDIRNSEVYRCPEVQRLIPGFGMNQAANGLSLGVFYDPSIKILTTDMLNAADPTDNRGVWAVAYNGTGRLADGNVHANRHGAGAVYGFLDCHAKWHKEAAVMATNLAGEVLMWDPASVADR